VHVVGDQVAEQRELKRQPCAISSRCCLVGDSVREVEPRALAIVFELDRDDERRPASACRSRSRR
jgi:hypothetical protein